MDSITLLHNGQKLYNTIRSKISKKNIKIILILSGVLCLYIFRKLIFTLLILSGVIGLTYLYYSDSDDTLKNE